MRKNPHPQSREAQTLGGKLEYERTVYECPDCRCSIAPLDKELGLRRGDKISRGIRRKVAMAAAEKSFEGAVVLLKEVGGLEISEAEVKRIAMEEGERLGCMQEEQDKKYLQPPKKGKPSLPAEIHTKRLVIEADATTVLTVKGEEHKSVYCAVGFGLETRGKKEGSKRPFISQKRYTTGLTTEDFSERLRALAMRMGMRKACEVAFIADGAPGLWKMAKQILPPGTIFIQDFWHVSEHLATIANELHGMKSKKAKQAQHKWQAALRESKVDTIIQDLEKEFKKRRGAKREMLCQEINYLKNGRSRMDYKAFEANGWPIGSGAVEGTCKHLVKERFCVTGARWRRSRIPLMLALREALANEEWDKYWNSNYAA